MLRAFLSDERGTETVEWGVMAGLIVVAVIAVVGNIGTWVNTRMTALETGLGTP